MSKYTLDRIDDGFYVFLSKDDESQQRLIAVSEVNISLTEGDIVNIHEDGTIELLEEETKITKDKVDALIEKLKKNNS
ncbi:DUF3006 domain-containing protein [Lysinibacillus endophyticus]|uniref:DUF3006 domain-containing protein n=1 Tax=Ureibacillus endophyticus TaxID=1978490 RepID=A0A494Z759_9BACL|nr:DUF3006 domain-containing protein [Lysinibacillus endophyticus]MCP1144670.1 DUF3006 domain-containing protein [Lysinibacillus endophyticus]RKQ18340.1 DUF3006 domain-containing protein [Lysinibacillus endophyticus]